MVLEPKLGILSHPASELNRPGTAWHGADKLNEPKVRSERGADILYRNHSMHVQPKPRSRHNAAFDPRHACPL
ncbi:hypothetical protein YERSI8AC_260009 [Enterobacterales bacterium 8AC]|nr:hypothetical protein YERSI8AC_260009 [Enterobacterales bacterium 8AC]